MYLYLQSCLSRVSRQLVRGRGKVRGEEVACFQKISKTAIPPMTICKQWPITLAEAFRVLQIERTLWFTRCVATRFFARCFKSVVIITIIVLAKMFRSTGSSEHWTSAMNLYSLQWILICRTKKASEAEVDVNDAVCVSKIQPEQVTLPDGKFCRREVLDEKRARLRQLFACETAEMDNSLRQTGYAFIPTQPWNFSAHSRIIDSEVKQQMAALPRLSIWTLTKCVCVCVCFDENRYCRIFIANSKFHRRSPSLKRFWYLRVT